MSPIQDDDARIAELEAQNAKLQHRADYLEGEIGKADEWKAQVRALEALLVTCRLRCERAEKRLAQELRRAAAQAAHQRSQRES